MSVSAEEPKEDPRPSPTIDELLAELPEGWQPVTWQEMYAEQPCEQLRALAEAEKAEQAISGGARTQIDGFVQRYLKEHPDFEYPPSGDFHSAILANGTMKSWIIDRIGGPLPFWRAMLRAGRVWFPPGDTSREFRLFCTFFEIEGCTWWNGIPIYQELEMEYSAWRKNMRSPGGLPENLT